MLQSKTNIFIIVLCLAAVLGAGLATWWLPAMAPESEPEAANPTATTTDPVNEQPEVAQHKDLIRVTTPLPESTISSPLSIAGEARGTWFFEGDFPVVLTNWDGLIIAEGIATAEGEWMTEEYVPFSATLTFTADTDVSDRASLILQKSNPSGMPEQADAFEYTVYFE